MHLHLVGEELELLNRREEMNLINNWKSDALYKLYILNSSLHVYYRSISRSTRFMFAGLKIVGRIGKGLMEPRELKHWQGHRLCRQRNGRKELTQAKVLIATLDARHESALELSLRIRLISSMSNWNSSRSVLVFLNASAGLSWPAVVHIL
jgi:hypothetical protein